VVAPDLADELREMATWLNLDDIRVGTKGNLSKPVRSALSSRVSVEK